MLRLASSCGCTFQQQNKVFNMQNNFKINTGTNTTATNTDAKTYQSKDPLKVLASHEKNKTKKYLAPCLAQHHHFTPFVVSADGLLGREADAVVCKLAFTYLKRLTNHTQWRVALYAITLALPFSMPLMAVFKAPGFPQAV